MQGDIQMPVVLTDPLEGITDLPFGPLQQLEEYFPSANERPSHIVARVAPPRVHKDSSEHCLVESEWLRGVDNLQQSQ